jgi:hypothetical protein
MIIDPGGATPVDMRVTEKLLPRFFQILGQGIWLEVQVGCSLKDLLCNQLGIPAEYLDSRIQTIFLNAKPVDNVAEAVAGPGAVIALSAAMPGLVGAVMRKGGHYAALRQTISYSASSECPAAARSMVRLKLFNLVAAELGPPFLKRGVGMRGVDFKDFLARHADALAEGCLQIRLEEDTIDLDTARNMDWDQPIQLTVTEAQA